MAADVNRNPVITGVDEDGNVIQIGVDPTTGAILIEVVEEE